MGRKPDYRPVGYVVSAEGKKITQSKRHSKAKGYLKKAGGGEWQKDWACVCYKGIQYLGKFRYAIAARAVTLAVKRSLSEHNKKSKMKLQQQELTENKAR